MFLYFWKFTPVLPPIAASTWERRVVGIYANLTPLLYILAAKPTISVVMPPPTASNIASLSAPFSSSHEHIPITVSRVFASSAASTSIIFAPRRFRTSATCFSAGHFCATLASTIAYIFEYGSRHEARSMKSADVTMRLIGFFPEYIFICSINNYGLMPYGRYFIMSSSISL